MANIPTFIIKNSKTKELRTINQSDYQPSLSMALGGDWEIVKTVNKGNDIAQKTAIENRQIIDNLKRKRQINPLKKVVFT